MFSLDEGRPSRAAFLVYPSDETSRHFNSKLIPTARIKDAFDELYAADPTWWKNVDYLQLHLRIDRLSAHRKLELQQQGNRARDRS
jgi:hypothetical protein